MTTAHAYTLVCLSRVRQLATLSLCRQLQPYRYLRLYFLLRLSLRLSPWKVRHLRQTIYWGSISAALSGVERNDQQTLPLVQGEVVRALERLSVSSPAHGLTSR
jgi:hypothetical protein